MSAAAESAPMSVPHRLLVWDDLTVWAVAGISFVVHLAVAGRYGFFRDEFTLVAEGFHPAWGYVDGPALVPMIARFAVTLFGASAVGLRVFSALACAIVIVLAGYFAREIGAGKFGASLAALTIAVTPAFVSGGHLFGPSVFEQLVWAGSTALLARAMRSREGWLWVPLGAALGIGAHTRGTVITLAIGIVIGMVLTQERTWFRTPWPWIGAFVAALLAFPAVFWQIANGWPMLEFTRMSSAAYRHDRSFVWFVLLQPLSLGIGGLVLTLCGLWWFFRAHDGAWRLFGWLFLAVAASCVVFQGRENDLAPACFPLIAAGAVLTEEFVRRHSGELRRVIMAVVVVLALPFLPLALPVLSVRAMLNLHQEAISPDFAEQIGWPEFVGAVAAAYQTLPPDEQVHTLVLAANTGEAGAVDLLGRRYDLPPAISGQNAYYLWGTGKPDAVTYIATGFSSAQLSRYFDEVVQAATVMNHAGAPNAEAGRAVFICRRPKQPLPTVWAEFRQYG